MATRQSGSLRWTGCGDDFSAPQQWRAVLSVSSKLHSETDTFGTGRLGMGDRMVVEFRSRHSDGQYSAAYDTSYATLLLDLDTTGARGRWLTLWVEVIVWA